LVVVFGGVRGARRGDGAVLGGGIEMADLADASHAPRIEVEEDVPGVAAGERLALAQIVPDRGGRLSPPPVDRRRGLKCLRRSRGVDSTNK
jgi:hypothetical protein